MSTRLEIVVIAERASDGKNCFVILDYLTNSVSSDSGAWGAVQAADPGLKATQDQTLIVKRMTVSFNFQT